MVGSTAMKDSLIVTIAVRSWRVVLVATLLFLTWTPAAFPQDVKGCEGVKYSKRPFAEYSPEKLQQRIRQDPSDVDALINLGIRLEEQDQTAEAKALYERAIKAKPDCYLGYYFAGLAAETISTDSASEADTKIRKAISLDPRLENDPNVKGFMKRHSRPMASAVPTDTEPPPLNRQILAGSNRFYVGMGVGIILAAIIFYFVRLRRTSLKGT
jgi:tetratricopeptide (TPR) repeat protein